MQQRKVNYLGRTISVVGVTCDKEEVAALKDWPVPVNVKDVCSFLGTAKYCRRLMPSFAELASPLTALTLKKVPFDWSVVCPSAFHRL